VWLLFLSQTSYLPRRSDPNFFFFRSQKSQLRPSPRVIHRLKEMGPSDCIRSCYLLFDSSFCPRPVMRSLSLPTTRSANVEKLITMPSLQLLCVRRRRGPISTIAPGATGRAFALTLSSTRQVHCRCSLGNSSSITDNLFTVTKLVSHSPFGKKMGSN
jgi:hypothetical protein